MMVLLVVNLSGCQLFQSGSRNAASVSTIDGARQAVADQEPQYQWMNADVKLKMETPERSMSGSGHLKIRKDSLLWLSVSPALGIEVLRAQISQDSVQILDRVNNQHRQFGFRRLSQMVNPAQRSFSFQNLTNILTGQPVFLINSNYQLQSADSNGIAMSYENEVFQEKLTLLPALLKTHHYHLKKPATKQSLNVNYEDYQKVDRYQIPGSIEVIARRPKPIKLTVTLKNVSFEEEDQVSFTVPDNYE